MAVILEEVGPRITLEPVDQAPAPVSASPRFMGKPNLEKNLFLAGKGAANIIPGLPFATQYYQAATENWLTKLLSPKPLPGVEVEPEKAAITKAIERIKPIEALTADTIPEQVIQEGTTMLGRLPFYIYTMGGMAKIPFLAAHPVLSGSAGFGAVSGVEKILEGEPGQAPAAAVRGAATYPLLHGAGKLGILGKTPLARRLLTGVGFGGLSATLAPKGEKVSQAILGTGLGMAFPAGQKAAVKAPGATPEDIAKVADIIAQRGTEAKFTGKPAQYPPMIPETVDPLAEQGRLNATLKAMETSQPRKAELDAAAEMPLHPAPKTITLEEVSPEVAKSVEGAKGGGIMYHQSQGDTGEFLQKGDKGYKRAGYSQAGEGIYFSPNKELVQSKYGKGGGKLVSAQLDIKNPLDLGDKDAMYFDGRKVNYGDIVVENFKRFQSGEKPLPEPDIILSTISKKAKKWIIDNGYDAITGMKGEMWTAPETVIFDKSQIKLSTPTVEGKAAEIEIKKVTDNILKNNPDVSRTDAKAMAKDVIKNRKTTEGKVISQKEKVAAYVKEEPKNIPGELNKPRFTGKPSEQVSAQTPAAEAVAKPQAEPAAPAPGKIKAPPRFPEDQTKELMQAAEAKGLVRRKGEKVQDMRLKNLLRHYNDASFDQMKDYISELTGTPKAPAKIFKLYGNIAQDTEAMKILNQVSSKWRDINKMETNTLDTPRIMEKVTGKDLWDDNILADNTFSAIASADDAMFARLSKEIDELTANKAGVIKGSKESAEIHRKLEAGEPLTPKEKAIGEYIHRKNDAWIAEANEMRDRLGKPRIPYRQKYYTHIIERNLLSDFFKGDEKAMGNISEGQLEAIRKGDYTKGNMPFNRFAQQRLGNKTKYDLIGNYETYLRTILREIYYTPAITHARKFIEYSLVKQPNAYKAIDRMLNEMKGKPSELDKDILGIVASSRPIKYMRHKMSESALLGNLNFWATNASNFTTSYGEIGNYMNKGLSKFLTDKTWRDFAFKNSSVLRQRTIDPDLDPSKFNKLEEMAGYITNLLEYNNVGSTYVGAYFKGKEQLGYSEAKAMKYADAIARRTQVGYKPYELNAWMRSNKGKVLSQFQTWSFNAMNHMVYDLGLGTIPKKVMSKFTGKISEEPKIRWKAFLTLAATSMMMNALYKQMGLREPYNPVSVLPTVPFVSSSRYEQPGVVKTIEDIKTATGFEDLMKAAEGQPVPEHKPGTKEKAAVRAGLRFVPGGTQIGRFIGGQVLPENQGRFKGKSE